MALLLAKGVGGSPVVHSMGTLYPIRSVLPLWRLTRSCGGGYVDFDGRGSANICSASHARESLFDGPGGDLRPRGKAQLPKDVADMHFGRPLAHD